MDIFSYWDKSNILSDNKKYIHIDDNLILNELDNSIVDDFDFSFPPGPYFGSLKTASIVLCYANPGIDKSSQNTSTSCAGREELFNQLLGNQNYPYHLGGWREWFTPKANSLFDSNIENASKKIAVFNIVPYASKNFNRINTIANCIPSVWKAQDHLRNILIPAAKKNEILLIICRASQLWGIKTSYNSKNIIISDVRNGFSLNVKEIVHNWILDKDI